MVGVIAEDLLGPGATVFADGGRIDVQANADEPAAVATVALWAYARA